jgi:hypothetical protein
VAGAERARTNRGWISMNTSCSMTLSWTLHSLDCEPASPVDRYLESNVDQRRARENDPNLERILNRL